jgi:hypothetical protein
MLWMGCAVFEMAVSDFFDRFGLHRQQGRRTHLWKPVSSTYRCVPLVVIVCMYVEHARM